MKQGEKLIILRSTLESRTVGDYIYGPGGSGSWGRGPGEADADWLLAVRQQLWFPTPAKTTTLARVSSSLDPGEACSDREADTGLTFRLWKTFPCSMKKAEGARLREVLAEAVRRSRGFRKPAWSSRDVPVSPGSSRAPPERPSYLSALSAHSQRLSEGGALVVLASAAQVGLRRRPQLHRLSARQLQLLNASLHVRPLPV